jgi:hypothetical protein
MVSAVARVGFQPHRLRLTAAAFVAALVVAGVASVARAQQPGGAGQTGGDGSDGDDGDDGNGYTPPAGLTPPLQLNGYIDVGFAKAQGDGTSFAAGDTRLPADYAVDPFAPAVNSRGDVASNDPGGRLTNGFLPRSVGIGGRPSFLINTVNFDLKYTARGFLPAATRRGPIWSRPSVDSFPSIRKSWPSASASSIRCSASSTWRTRPTSAPGSRRR